jgi:hypothetical protein
VRRIKMSRQAIDFRPMIPIRDIMGDQTKTVKKGRPTKLDDVLQARIIHLAMSGCSVITIAKITGIHERTVSRWIAEHGDFRQSVLDAREVADAMVEGALFHKAIGYQLPAQKQFLIYVGTGKKRKAKVLTHEYIEALPPSEAAAAFWLKNRQPDKWRENPKDDSGSGREEPGEIVIEFADEVPNKDAK